MMDELNNGQQEQYAEPAKKKNTQKNLEVGNIYLQV